MHAVSLVNTPKGDEAGQGGDELVDAVLGASRALVAVAARSLANVAEDVTLAQYRVLVELAARGPQRLADLAAALGVDRSTATRMCDRLVRKRLVQRRRIEPGSPRGAGLADRAPAVSWWSEVSRRRRAEIAAILGRMPARTSARGAERSAGVRRGGRRGARAGLVAGMGSVTVTAADARRIQRRRS